MLCLQQHFIRVFGGKQIVVLEKMFALFFSQFQIHPIEETYLGYSKITGLELHHNWNLDI